MSYPSPRYVTYRERLSPEAPPIEVELPQSRHDAFDLLATINKLATTDAAQWQAMVRQYTSSSWYMLALFMSGTQRLDPFTGRPEIDCDYLFNYSLEMQFDGERVLDKSARGQWKSTWRCYVGATNLVLRDPNEVIAIVAHEKTAAGRHGTRTINEWLSNVELNAAWPDVFWGTDKNAWPLWSMEHGATVRRTISAVLPTISWHSILTAPTGSRVGVFIPDDIESETTVESEDMRKKTLQRFTSFLETGGRVPRIWPNATHHHSAGLVTHLEKSGAFRVRCHPIEDTSKPAPDIAELYDACNGVMPLRDELGRHEELPKALREIRLDGAPVYFHPLEVAMKRLTAMSTPGGLANFYMQNFGDPLAGQDRTLDKDWIRYYKAPPIEWARGAYLYILVDPSKGVGDPTFARVEACKSDQSISWVDGLRRKLAPSEFAPAIYQLYSKWRHVGRVVQIRVEEFAQSTWTYHLRTYFDSIDAPCPMLVSCSRHTESNKESEGRRREWNALEPLYRMGRRIFPESGIWVQDDPPSRRTYNLVEYYVEDEYGQFPIPPMDDGLAADALLAVDKGKNEAGKNIPLSLEFPEDEEMAEMAERSGGRRWQRERESADSWMEW